VQNSCGLFSINQYTTVFAHFSTLIYKRGNGAIRLFAHSYTNSGLCPTNTYASATKSLDIGDLPAK